MAQALHHRFSFDEYLALEDRSEVRHEFLDGLVFAMSGGSPEHAAVTATWARLLGNALQGKPCRVFSPDLRLRVRATGLASYADVTVVCSQLEHDPNDPTRQTIVNPTLLVEVLSPSTEDYDRGDKLGHYKQIPSLEEVVFVAHDRHEVEVVRRETDGSWSRHVSSGNGRVVLKSVGCEISVNEIYADPLGS